MRPASELTAAPTISRPVWFSLRSTLRSTKSSGYSGVNGSVGVRGNSMRVAQLRLERRNIGIGRQVAGRARIAAVRPYCGGGRIAVVERTPAARLRRRVLRGGAVSGGGPNGGASGGVACAGPPCRELPVGLAAIGCGDRGLLDGVRVAADRGGLGAGGADGLAAVRRCAVAVGGGRCGSGLARGSGAWSMTDRGFGFGRSVAGRD